MNKNKKNNKEKGAALLIVVVFFLMISTIIVGGVVGPLISEFKISKDFIKSKSSFYVAEAAVEDVVHRIKNGYTVSSIDTVSIGSESASVTVLDVGNIKEIISTATVDSHIRRVKTELTTSVTGVSFFYGAQVGSGGFEMRNNSQINGAGGAVGNVYSNGPIDGDNGAVITGDATVATSITEDIDARSLVCNQDQIVGKSNPNIDYAQSFSPSSTGPLAKISIYIKKVGNPDSKEIRIVPDNAGSPGSTQLTSGTLNKNLVGTGYGWVDVTFNTPPVLTVGQTYWLVLDAGANNAKYWVWCSDNTGGFINGVAKYSKDWDDDTWTQITGDLTFKTYTGSGASFIDSVTINGTAKANTISNSFIGTDAYYQTILNTSVAGASYPGSSDSPVLTMPVSDANIAQFKSDAEVGGVIIGNCGDSGDPSCVVGNGQTISLGPKKINGNLNLSNAKTIYITGTLYVTGNIDIDGTGVVVSCDPSFGSESCIIITDGWVHISNNVTFAGSGQTGSYLMILTTLPGCNGLSSSTGCTHHYSGMDIHNNSGGAIFYASESMINLHNNVNITSAVAYKLRLDNNAAVTYEIGVSNQSFSSGPSGGWSVSNWNETE